MKIPFYANLLTGNGRLIINL